MDNGKDLNQALAWFDKAWNYSPMHFSFIIKEPIAWQSWVEKMKRKLLLKNQKHRPLSRRMMNYVRLNDKLLAELEK
jgi:hypothetical protein